MEYKLLGTKNDIAQLLADEVLIYEAQSALDVLATAQYETGCDKFILSKACFTEDFFVLSTGIAGAVLQKFVNYRKKVAIIGDYAGYTSKPLQDFIYESNKGNSIYFLSDIGEALRKLSGEK